MSQSSIIDADIHSPKLGFDFLKHGNNFILIPHITLDGHQLTNSWAQLTGKRLPEGEKITALLKS